MSKFETIVRPVVFPNIRPAPARSLPPADDPTKGFCVIKGSSGKVVDLPMSWNVSSSKERPVETERRVDEARIYQVQVDGAINEKNYIDVQVANRIKFRRALARRAAETEQAKQQQKEYDIQFFKHLEEQENIRIRRRNVIIKNPDAPED